MATQRRGPLTAMVALLAAAGAVGSGALAGATSAPPSAPADDSFADVEATANDEGEVVIYASTPEVLAERIVAGFNETYPDIEVQFSFFTNAELASRVEQEQSAGTDTADIVGMADFAYFAAADEAGALAAPTGPSFAAWPADYLASPASVILYAQPLVISWNTGVVEEPIVGYEDSLDPALQGQLASTDIASGSIVAAWYDWLRETQGPDFWTDLAAQEPTFGSGAQAVTQSVAAGEEAVGLFSSISVVKGLQETGAPIEYVVPNPSFGVGSVAAILEAAPHPSAAQVFMNWVLSEEGQAVIAGDAEYASVLGVENGIPIDTLTIWRGEQGPDEIDAIVAEWNEVFA